MATVVNFFLAQDMWMLCDNCVTHPITMTKDAKEFRLFFLKVASDFFKELTDLSPHDCIEIRCYNEQKTTFATSSTKVCRLELWKNLQQAQNVLKNEMRAHLAKLLIKHMSIFYMVGGGSHIAQYCRKFEEPQSIYMKRVKTDVDFLHSALQIFNDVFLT